MPTNPTFIEELDLVSKGYSLVAGVDEVGRGPLAGPVVAGAVILPQDWLHWTRKAQQYPSHKSEDPREYLRDSKQLSRNQRDRLYASITTVAISYGIGLCSAEAIDQIGIVKATRQAMVSAINNLSPSPDALLIDAMALPEISLPCRSIINGDALCGSIAAGSIIAKVTRDQLMDEVDQAHPDYGFARHKGYGTPEHIRQLRLHGPCTIHRKTFEPIRSMLLQQCML
ncbi:ribonuclease HII [Dehalococcoidia bacterium]|nr:ribonuclease HII [Dehalococcoidia bacterium]